MMPAWVPRHFGFSDYIIGEHPRAFGARSDLRESLGCRARCVVTVRGTRRRCPS